MFSSLSTVSPAARDTQVVRHPQQTSEQLPPHLAERLHSSEGDAA
jgi:hypothetical protein